MYADWLYQEKAKSTCIAARVTPSASVLSTSICKGRFCERYTGIKENPDDSMHLVLTFACDLISGLIGAIFPGAILVSDMMLTMKLQRDYRMMVIAL